MPESIFQTFRNRLIDLSAKNRSLYLPRTEGLGVLDLKELDFLNGENSFEILRKAIQSKKDIPLIPVSDPRIGSVNILSKTFSRLAFRDQLTLEETGEHSLFMAWPFVEGKLMSGQILRAPLLLLGGKLTIEKEQWFFKISDDWQWNPAFLLAYSLAQNKKPNVDALNDALNELPVDAMAFRTGLAKLLNDHFSIQLSSSLFEDNLAAFPFSQVSIDSDRFQDGRLMLKSYALLGLFAQKGSFLYSDYDLLDRDFGGLNLEQLFLEHFANGEILPLPREEQLFPVFPLDASQEKVLMNVRQGKSVVVEGPPGTGKSQLIANLISDYCARGKKVLVVSQKRAALDVVFGRLEQAGFGQFLGLVHDFRADQKSLFQKIKRQIEAIEAYQEQNRGIDSIQLEREISQYSKTISRLSKKFEGFRNALFDTELAGIPIKAMYLNADLKQAFFDDPGLIKLDFDQARDFEKDYKIFNSYHTRFKGTFWESRISFAHFEPAVFPRIDQCLKEIGDFNSQTRRKVSDEFISRLITNPKISENLEELHLAFLRLQEPKLAVSLIFDPKKYSDLAQVQHWLISSKDKLNQLTLGISPKADSWVKLEKELDILEVKVNSWFGKIQVKLSKSKFPLAVEILQKSGLEMDKAAVDRMRQEVEVLKRLDQELGELPEVGGLPRLHLTLGSLSDSLNQSISVLEWMDLWKSAPELLSAIHWNERDFQEQIKELDEFSRSFTVRSGQWKTYLSEAQILEVLEKGTQLETGNKLDLNQVFSELVAFDRFLTGSKPGIVSLFRKIEKAFPDWDCGQQIEAFWNSWYLAWIARLEAKNPVLAEAGSIKMQHELEELKTAILEKRKISRDIALLRLREQIADDLEFNRLGNRVTYRELLHQVGKKRQRWPIRKLIEEMGDEVFRLLPCWLASPETVSALFPLGQDFDLVVFDEASQCQVERGLPAMLRGRQVVIAGDSKQLRPSDFYQVRWETEEEGLEYEAESLLELAGNFFEKHQLKGHYRSADPGLIHFSNTRFYDGQLETLPDYAISLAGKPAFTWKKVEGIWSDQMNKTEADEVVLKVETLHALSPSDSIGIVTGNYFQMELIREKLWKAGFQGTAIKVRNIENVQGDEFDQVILSLGYAPNREGKLVTNFGLLGKSGAENRLNVAVTRARKFMHVISSIEPADFRPNQLKNPGLLLLREFLAFVQNQSVNPSVSIAEAKIQGYETAWSLKSRLLKDEGLFSGDIPSIVMDLLYKEPNGGQRAVLTDDQRFFNAPTAKAAMAYHPMLLEQKGWKWKWKWSRNRLID